MKYFRNKNKTAWYGFEPKDKTGLVEITEAEWNAHLKEIEPSKISEKEIQIAKLKAELASTDYKAIKYAEGLITEEDYAPIKAARQELRNQIKKLEK